MRIFLSLLLLVLIFPIKGNDVHATVALGNPDLMAIGCASGFTRIQPKFCSKNTPVSVTLTSDTVCRQIDLVASYGVPSSVLLVQLAWTATLATGNAIATRGIQTDLFIENTCSTRTNVAFPILLTMREFAATAATTMANIQPIVFDTTNTTGGVIYYRSQLNSCTGCTMGFYLMGYYD